MMTEQGHAHKGSELGRGWRIIFRLVGLVLILWGLGLAIPGVRLISLGGSWYYTIAGIVFAAAGVQILRLRASGLWLFTFAYVGTLLWALYEVGLTFWPLVPRVGVLSGLALVVYAVFYLTARKRHEGQGKGLALVGALGSFVIVMIILGGTFTQHGVVQEAYKPAAPVVAAAPPPLAGAQSLTPDGEWHRYGRTGAGTRYSPLKQITPENVKNLEVAWQYHTGDIATGGADDQHTPIMVEGVVYGCTPHNKVYALDAETGQELWVFDGKGNQPIWQRCRGVTYYNGALTLNPNEVPPPASGVCSRRIIMNTISAELYALDAKTGKPCADFGSNGKVDLKIGLGEVKPGFYIPTSAPTVAGDRIILGAFVLDNASTDEPSGVIRAYKATTGELLWAWDLGNPAITKEPPPGQTYTRSTPNVWSTPAFDLKLGMVYLPMGNGTPDMFAADRSKDTEKYSSSVVALDLATGKEKWVFQTVHHDMWDMDLPAQPSLVDVPDGQGKTIPALAQITKSGQIFLLNRQDGTAIAEVKELPAPQNPVPGDWVTATQPRSIGMPRLGEELLSEARMWGTTPFDQLYCRIWFKESRYDGQYTPYSEQGTILYPSLIGGFNWGSATVDESRNIMFLNDIRIPVWIKLVPREQAAQYDDPQKLKKIVPFGFKVPLEGTPYVGLRTMMFSPLGIPCNEPPFGTYSAVDLNSHKLLWQRPAGDTADSKVVGVPMPIPAKLGMPTLGGGLTTASGLAFHAGAMDFNLRAFDITTGEELWKQHLPVGSQGGPMTYISPKSGEQFLVLAVGGNRASINDDKSDLVIAYKLKK